MSWQISWVLLAPAFFYLKSAKLDISINTDADWILTFRSINSNHFNFFSVFKDCFDKHGCNFDYVNKMTTLDLLKIKVLWNKGCYGVIIYIHDVTNKFLSREPNYIVDLFMWPKFGNSNISVREDIITSVLEGFDKKNYFFWGVVLDKAK